MKTFKEICAVEPRLKSLFDRIPSIIDANPNFWVGWSKIKMEMSTMVGFHSSNPELGSSDDYETAYQALLKEAERHAEAEGGH